MGLLDDAIREHLDLKRRRGADPTEIERAEREALGPVRREPLPSEPAPPADDEREEEVPRLAFEDAAPMFQPGEESYEDEDSFDDTFAEPSRAASERTGREDPDWGSSDWGDEPVQAPEPEPAPEATANEDVLQETPEFLSETPEHDRLWFEQRPPKDFDFDE